MRTFVASTFFLLFSIITNGQEPAKKDNAIIVKGVAFNKVKEVLLDAGIFIAEQNAEDGTIVTQRRGIAIALIKTFIN